MQLIRGIKNLKPFLQGCVATIGNFDGLHLGHQQLIQHTLDKAKALNLPAMVITFEPLPTEFFSAENPPARLLRFREKLLLLKEWGVDVILCLRFNQQLAEMTADTFVKTILVENLKIKHLIVGDDFHFGKQRQGNFILLEQLASQYGFSVEKMPTFLFNNERVGSSRVRTALAAGDLKLVEQLLNRPYSISGRIIHGQKLGRQLGFPTANIPLRRRSIPLQGAYAVKVSGIGTEALPGVANIGNRPTVLGKRNLLEVHVLDLKYDIYGRYLTVDILYKLRDEHRFDCLEDLKIQITKDVQHAREYLACLENVKSRGGFSHDPEITLDGKST